MSKIPISVCIIAKNEEKYIEECLRSISGYGFEIVVTDTGSTDRTKEIASRYTDKIYDFEWINDFSAARNFCASKASNNWILSLDCDEVVNSIDIEELKKRMKKCPKCVGMMHLNEVILKVSGARSYVTAEAMKLYNRIDYAFYEPIHEQICIKDERKRDEALRYFTLPMEVTHYGYALPKEELWKKAKRDFDILTDALKKKPDNSYIHYQMGQSLFIMDEYEEAMTHYEKSLYNIDSMEYAYAEDLVCSLAKLYAYVKRNDDAIVLMEKYLSDFPKARYLYTYADMLKKGGQKLKALLIYIKATAMEDADTLGANLADCFENIIAIYKEMGNEEMAQRFVDKYHESTAKREKILGTQKPAVSVCIIAKNEEKYIEECLKRIKPYGFEIVVTDTGSTDRTKEIASKYADKVLDFEWVKDFSAARNFCAQNASNDWIIALDCDEYINSIDMKGIRLLTERYPSYVGIIRMKNLQVNDKGEKGYNTDDLIRIYNRNYYTFEAPIHEQIVMIDKARRNEKLNWFLAPMEVVHQGYAITAEDMRKKQQRNLEILETAMENEPDNAYLRCQTGFSYMALHEYDKAITYCREGLSINEDCSLSYVQEMIIALAKCYVFVGKKEDALAVMEKYKNCINTAKFVYAHANILIDNNMLAKALLMLIKVTTMNDAETLGEDLLHAYERIVAIYQASGNAEMAVNFEDKLMQCRQERDRVINS